MKTHFLVNPTPIYHYSSYHGDVGLERGFLDEPNVFLHLRFPTNWKESIAYLDIFCSLAEFLYTNSTTVN